MTTNNTTARQCTVEDWCALREDHQSGCRTAAQVAVPKSHPAVNELFIWLPEWLVTGLFFFGALVASGWLSLLCLLISVATAVWVVANRAVVRRRSDAARGRKPVWQLPAANTPQDGETTR